MFRIQIVFEPPHSGFFNPQNAKHFVELCREAANPNTYNKKWSYAAKRRKKVELCRKAANPSNRYFQNQDTHVFSQAAIVEVRTDVIDPDNSTTN